MKSYPEFPKNVNHSELIYAWDKLDGSQIRAEYSKKRGFYKFAKRSGLIGPDEPILGESISLIQQQADTIIPIFQKAKWENVVCFFEFYGPNSFAGLHEDEPHQITLFDVNVFKRGILPTDEFYSLFQETRIIPALLYIGKINSDLKHSVRNGSLEGMTFEGVVCKSPCSKLMYKN